MSDERGHQIEAVDALTVRAPVPEVIRFGDWVMEYREFGLVRVRTRDGICGYGFTLSRDGPIAEMIHDYIGPRYVGRPTDEPEQAFASVQRSNLSCLVGGIGLRALSIVDLAVWDAEAKRRGLPIAAMLGGSNVAMPVTGIAGYPPSIGPAEVIEQVTDLCERGYRRVKLPMAPDVVRSKARLEAAASVSDDLWVGCDGAWVFNAVDDAVAFLESLDMTLGWFEDAFPPGNARIIAALRERSPFPIAFGDEQGGAHYPESLVAHNSVDFVRVDVTTMGGITSIRDILAQADAAGMQVAPHMNALEHAQIFGGLGRPDLPLEWGIVGSGVDQFADSLRQPVVRDGLMDPLPDEPGFGRLVNPDWLRSVPHDDPAGIIDEAAALES